MCIQYTLYIDWYILQIHLHIRTYTYQHELHVNADIAEHANTHTHICTKYK